MNNEELIQKMKEDMKLRGFSKYSYSNYLNKVKQIIKYFKKPMEEVTTKEIREYLMICLKEKKEISERSVNYYNSVIRFIYDVTLDIPINKKQIPMYRKKRILPKILKAEELSIFFNACDNYMYKTIFDSFKYGYGSAIAIFVIIECLILTGVLRLLFRDKEKA